ncbi:MAG: Fe(3+) ABC transporter substrate-binding protein [Alphaproteobacteria bacterium]|nr:Fe(3+) ABC transporter substrate-binding protein [Alphaproteobacteria bacterium]
MNMQHNRLFMSCMAGAALLLSASSFASAAEVNLYTARKDHLIKPILDKFTQQTGIKVNLLSAGEDQLIERLKSEGANSPADIFQTTDVARLNRARVEGLLQPISSAVLEKNVPAKYRDPQNYWFGQSARARVIFYNKDRVKPSDLSGFEGLADPKWKGRICVRSSASAYNQSLLAGMIAVDGLDKSEKWAKAIVDNMARKPQGGDRDQITAVAAGQCDIAIANTYYFAGMMTSDKAEERDAAAKVALFWPDQQGRGAHMNISGAGLTKAAKNKAEAIKLMEFLSSAEAQQFYAEANNEFPVLPSAKRSALVTAWGSFKEETINVAMLGENNASAIRIFDRAGWR